MNGFTRAAMIFSLSLCAIGADAVAEAARFIHQNIGLSDSLSLEQLRARVHPNQETSKQLRNLYHPEQIDHIVALRDGKGLEVQAYVTGPGRALIQRVTITTLQFKLPLGLQIGGSSLDDVYKAFGRMGKSENGPGGASARRFSNTDLIGFEESALLWFDRNQTLLGVEWHYPID